MPEGDWSNSYTIVCKLNEIISAKTNEVKAATVKWNTSGKLVVSVLPGQEAKILQPFFKEFHAVYTNSNIQPQDTRLDEEWIRVVVDEVPTGTKWGLIVSHTGRLHSSAELANEIMTYNPCLAKVKFAEEPCFFMLPADLAMVGKAESSLKFAILDKDIAEEIFTDGHIIMFGKNCQVCKYQESVKLTPQCFKCKGFGHTRDCCK